MKLAGFTPSLAHVLAVDPVSTNVLAMHLRAAGLITSGGRGPGGGAEMLPKDATNMFLAVLWDGMAKAAPEAVAAMREWPLYKAQIDHADEGRAVYENVRAKDLPFEFKCTSLGETLDGVFGALMFDGSIVSVRQPGAVQAGGLAFHQSRGFGDTMRLWFWMPGVGNIVLNYGHRSDDARLAERLDGAKGDEIRKRLRTITGIERVKRVEMTVLQGIAQLLSMPSPDVKIGFVDRAAPPPAKVTAKPKAKRTAKSPPTERPR